MRLGACRSLLSVLVHPVIGGGDVVAALSRIGVGGSDTAVIDLIRVAGGTQRRAPGCSRGHHATRDPGEQRHALTPPVRDR